ncbi:unnamed protein product [Camellia sinensis]
MPAEGATLADDGVEYSFAMEYHGPPITHDLPRAVPINVSRIPVASVVSQVPLSENLSLPVVQPILTPDITKKFSKELKLGCESTVSPTSVIAFERGNAVGGDDLKELASKELALGSETIVSPTSVIVLEESAPISGDFALSGELSSVSTLDFPNGHKDSGEFSGVIHCSAGLGSSSISHEHSHELLGAASSGTLGFSDSFDKSKELSGSLAAQRVSNGCKDSLDFNDLNQPDWASSESVLSLDYPSSRVSSHRIGDCNNEPVCDAKRTPVVTFRDIESDDGDFDEESSHSQPEIVRAKREPEVKVRKGACYRCFRGNRFTEKEVCIVCDAKYCSNCVLRAMGSMPEGRKCVTCIGCPIDESKRVNLGKCSRMLKRLLNDLEIRQIMKAEKLCEVNQLPPEYVFVNGKPLCQEELATLQSCPNPPKKLKPGHYWYDKVSGLWGKEGQKPAKIISPHLNVGGPIKVDASNGNTQVFINGREITKVELRMLQLAGVQCAGNPHFWVNEDGSYQEEGQKNTRGYIWGKAGTKLVCAVLSLPVPSKSANLCEQVNSLVSRTVPDYLEQRTLQKIILIGYNGSGTSTIFKQAKILYKDVPFSEDERENIKLVIQSNVYGYLGILLEGRERFEDASLNEMRKNQSCDEPGPSGNTDGNDGKTIYSICPRLKAFSDWLLKIMVSGNLEAIFPAASREYAPLVEELWNNAAIQATYKRRSELELLPSVASYFLERTAAVDILRQDYEPSDVDILYAEGVTSSNGLACLDFSFPHSAPDIDMDTADQHDSLLRYQLIRLQARGFGENCKWLEMFEDVRIVIFCVALSDYDQYAIDGDGALVNKMLLSKKFFENIVTHPTFDQMDFLLILNKFDMFEEKIERVPLTQCDWFDDFHPVMSRYRSNSNSNSNSNNINNSPSLGHLAFHYIAVKFKRLYSSLTDRKLYVSMVKGLEPDSVDGALKYAREILKWDEERPNFSLSEYSVYSTEVEMRIPRKFAKYCKEQLSNRVLLRGPSGNQWTVEIAAKNVFFQNGWEEFAGDHGLKETDFLVFRYNGNSCFSVSIFDGSGCERGGCYFVKKPREPCSHMMQKKEEEDSIDIINRDEDEEELKMENDVGKRVENIRLSYSTNRRQVTEEEKQKAYRLATRHSSDLPSVLITMQPSHVYKFFLLMQTIPKKWAVRHISSKSQEIQLRVPPREKKWTAQVRYRPAGIVVHKGWSKFSVDNNLEEHDVCIFELSQGGKGNNMPVVLDVFIYRVVDELVPLTQSYVPLSHQKITRREI